MGGIRIPKVLLSNKKLTKGSSNSSKSKTSKPYVSLTELGIPNDLNIFRQSILHSSNGSFDSIAWTTLDDVRREFFGIQKYWDYESAKKEALKYNSKWEFGKNSGAYDWALRNNCLDEICSHMLPKWNIELAKKEIKKYKSIGDIQKNNTSLYNWVNKNNLKEELFSHLYDRTYWTKEKVLEEAKKYNKKSDFQAAPSSAYKAAKRLGILDEACSHMVQNIRWDKNELIKMISNFKYEIDFRKFNNSAFKAAKRMNLTDKLLKVRNV
jgi:hypothetical protein